MNRYLICKQPTRRTNQSPVIQVDTIEIGVVDMPCLVQEDSGIDMEEIHADINQLQLDILDFHSAEEEEEILRKFQQKYGLNEDETVQLATTTLPSTETILKCMFHSIDEKGEWI